MPEQVDVIVMGLGVGGEEAGGKLAEAGLSVLGIERRLVGGECPYWGCIPSKMMIRAGNALAEARRVNVLAGTATATADWAPVAKRIREEATDDWDDKVAVDRFTGKGGTFVRGSGKLTGPGRVVVGGVEYEARRGVILAVGTTPVIPPLDGLAGTPFWTNKEAIETETVPSSMIVLGGGAIGVELAQVFARFGAAVTIVESHPRILPFDEPESSALATKALENDGVSIITGVSASKAAHGGGEFTLTLADGRTVTAAKLLVATGRKVNVEGLGLDTVGIDPAARAIEVDENMRAGDKLWAIGDATGHGAFTHMAMYQAGIAIRDILGQPGATADYRALPRVTFTDPEIGSVGLTEEQARANGLSLRVGITQVPASARGWIHKEGNDGFIKLVVDTATDTIVGATSAGPWGGEVLSALSVAVHAKVPVPVMVSMIYAYPTFHRAIEDALRNLK